jgi:cytochrome c oxidase cbb3-type subunit I/II
VTRPQASWHFRHFLNPRDVVENSVMPPYPWLVRKNLVEDAIPKRVRATTFLGAEYPDDQVGPAAIEHARVQARAIAESIEADGGAPADQLVNDDEIKQVIALIAYLQRLGTDIYKTPPAEPAPEPAPAGEQTASAGGR